MVLDIQDVQNHPVPLPNVKSLILSKVIEYCKYHVEAQEKDEDDKPKKGEEEVKGWDQEYIKVDLNTLYELILVGSNTFNEITVLQSFASVHCTDNWKTRMAQSWLWKKLSCYFEIEHKHVAGIQET